MMKYNKLYTALGKTGLICSVLITSNVFAASTNYDFTFATVQDVTLVETTELNFGGKLGLQPATTCEMRVGTGAANEPGVVDAKMADGSTDAAGANYGELMDAGCGSTAQGTDGTPGVYTITGAGGVIVDISLTSQSSGTNFNFVPSGIAVNYDGASDGDAWVAVAGGGTGSVKLANAADGAGNTPGSGFPTIGETRLYVGGAVTVTSLLLAGQEYTETFGIDVVYQ